MPCWKAALNQGRQLLEDGKGKKMDSSLKPPKEGSAANILILFQEDPFKTPDLHNSKIMYFSFVKPLNLLRLQQQQEINTPGKELTPYK